MKEGKTMRVGEAAHKLHVSPASIRNYCESGRLHCERTPQWQRYITQKDINEFIKNTQKPDLSPKEQQSNQRHDTTPQHTAFYIRSSSGDKKLLQQQINELTQAYGTPDKTYQDKASGLNEKRPGLNSLLTALNRGKYDRICVTYKDRLTRFGYEYIRRYATTNGCEISVLHDDIKYSQEQELMQDFMSLIASFSGKFYRLRGTKQQKELLETVEHELDASKAIRSQ